MRALVTGGAGFIGSHLVDALLDAGDEVTVVDHLQRGHTDNLAGAMERGIGLVRADVTDVGGMLFAFQQHRPEVVYHLAAQIDVRRSVEDPSTDAHVNIGGTAAVLEAARDTGGPRVLLASTAGVYGEPAMLPVPEDAPLAPLSPYGAGKAAAESYLELFRRLHGLSTLTLRLSNVYGPRQDPHGEAGVIAIFCGAAAEGAPEVTIFGDGSQTRDYIYVGDVVAAFVAAGRSGLDGVLNVATGTETPLTDVAAQLGLTAQHAPPRPGEVERSCLDPTAAGERLGWRAEVLLADGLERTLRAVARPAASG
ncbi:MAG TPA: GDP-mannose 4,6-dehydratase [Solirubrobacteraceae bacterium]|jgi:UDP-glucose 4-epimerase